MPNDRFDWHADIRARVAPARLHPQDEADVIEEVWGGGGARGTRGAVQRGA